MGIAPDEFIVDEFIVDEFIVDELIVGINEKSRLHSRLLCFLYNNIMNLF